MPKGPEFDAELPGDKYDSSMVRDNAFEKLDSCKDKETSQTGVVNGLSLDRCRSGKACSCLLVVVRLFCVELFFHNQESLSCL